MPRYSHRMTALAAPLSQEQERRRAVQFHGIEFREGPTGRRAAVRGGVDVWEVAQMLRAVREVDSALDDRQAAERVVEVTSSSLSDVLTAVAYARAHQQEIDAQVEANLAAAERLRKQFERR